MSSTDTRDFALEAANPSHDSPVLCLFRDKTTARPFETALMDCGISLLRARHGMHAYWLSIASKPALVIIDARQTNYDTEVLLSRMQTNTSLADVPVWVITGEELPRTPTGQITAVPHDILATDLAKQVRDLIVEKDRLRQQRIDDYFSLWDDAPATQEFRPKPSYIRTDAASEPRPLPTRKSSLNRIGR